MPVLIILIVLLVLAIIFFVTYPIIKDKIFESKYDEIYSKNIEKLANSQGFTLIHDISLFEYGKENIEFDHVLFGSKFIYLINNHYFNGYISGTSEDNAWISINQKKKEAKQIANCLKSSTEITKRFSKVTKVDQNMLVFVNLFNNECQFVLTNETFENSYVINLHNLKKFILSLEGKNISAINKEQLNQVIENIRKENGRGKNY